MAAADVSRFRQWTPSSCRSYQVTPSSGKRSTAKSASRSAVASSLASFVASKAAVKP
jgi:hypothetical protein